MREAARLLAGAEGAIEERVLAMFETRLKAPGADDSDWYFNLNALASERDDIRLCLDDVLSRAVANLEK